MLQKSRFIFLLTFILKMYLIITNQATVISDSIWKEGIRGYVK